MVEELTCSLPLPDTQSQTLGSQYEWSQSTPPVIASIWGRLYPTKGSLKSLGINRNSPLLPNHTIADYIDLSSPIFKLGRALDCDLCLKIEHVKNDILRNISKNHFQLTRNTSEENSPVILQDLSSNGTFINQQKVGKGNSRILDNKDEISLTHPSIKMFIFMDMFKNEQDGEHPLVTQKYFISRTLGIGAYGVVKLVYNKMTCEQYAMKIITKKRLTNGRAMNNSDKIMNEVNILKALHHPCIISIEEVIDTPNAVYIVLELMKGGELFNRVSNAGRLSERCTKILFRQMVLAVKYLHDQGVTHRDLKPENFLLESSNPETLVKLTDFGLSKFVGEEAFMRTMCGTPLYVAPEVLLAEGRKTYGCQVDVWSLGVILFICLSGYLPFSNEYKNMSLREQITTGRFKYSKSMWEGVSMPAKRLVSRILVVDPDKRITLEKILNEEWMLDNAVIETVDRLMHNNDFGFSPEFPADITIPNPVNPTAKRMLSEHSKANEPPPKKPKMHFMGIILDCDETASSSIEEPVDESSSDNC